MHRAEKREQDQGIGKITVQRVADAGHTEYDQHPHDYAWMKSLRHTDFVPRNDADDSRPIDASVSGDGREHKTFRRYLADEVVLADERPVPPRFLRRRDEGQALDEFGCADGGVEGKRATRNEEHSRRSEFNIGARCARSLQLCCFSRPLEHRRATTSKPTSTTPSRKWRRSTRTSTPRQRAGTTSKRSTPRI